jgi:hypothetical protein
MKALEFETTISDNKIQIPKEIQAELNSSDEHHVRVMIFLKEHNNDEKSFEKMTAGQFFKGYDDSDSIYDDL